MGSESTVMGSGSTVMGSESMVMGSVSTEMGLDSTVMGSDSTVMGSDSTVMGSDTAVTGCGPGEPQDACCPSRGLQSDLMVEKLLCEGIRHPGAPGSLVVSLTISVRRDSVWHLTRMFSQPDILIPWIRRRGSHGIRFQPSTTIICCSARRLRARHCHDVRRSLSPTSCARPSCVASDYAPVCTSHTHCFTIRARAHTCEHAHTAQAHAHALLGGCEHAAHYVLSFWRARVRETSIAFACFCTWPQPTPSASAPMRAREPMCYHHHVHCPITAISGLSASRVRSVVAASVRIRDGHAASSALC